MQSITKDQLKKRFSYNKPDNVSRNRGFALINVLSEEEFNSEHIPGSDNISHASDFDGRFDKNKEIVVYCASPECPASSEMAEELRARGFENVIVYEGGMKEWKSDGSDVEAGRSSVHEMRI